MSGDPQYDHRDRCAIVGIGETDYSRNSGRSDLTLATQAALAAIADAGLTPDDIDGIVRCDMDTVRHNDLIDSIGMPNVTYWARRRTRRGRRRRRWSARPSARSSPGRPRRCSCSASSTAARAAATACRRRPRTRSAAAGPTTSSTCPTAC